MAIVGAVTSNLTVTSKTANYTAAANEFVIADASSAAFTVTLPTSPYLNAMVAVKKTDNTTSAVSIVPGGTANLNGDTSAVLAVPGAAATFQYDGTNWQLLSTGTINTANPAAGLPAGGTTDQVLKKNSATPYDASWATAAAGGSAALPSWSKNRWMTAPRYGTGNLSFPVQNQLLFFPMQIPNACTLNGIYLYTPSSSTSGTALFGLYADNSSATSTGPAARLGYGTTSYSGSVGAWGVSLSPAVVFAGPSTVWVAAAASSSVNMYGSASGSLLTNMVIGGLGGFGSFYTFLSTSSYSQGTTPPADASNLNLTQNSGSTPLFHFSVSA